ncbi:MAG: hypothetical protein PHF84_02500 [bacterium]|nr:hypothetical protein [bacterium]
MVKRIIISLFGMFFLFGCSTNMTSFEKGNITSPRKVLIAAEDSAFKKKVVDRLVDKLGTKDWYFRIIGLNQLSKEDSGQYGAIILICKVSMGSIPSRVNTCLKKEQVKPKVVLFITSGSGDPLSGSIKTGIRGVDAVTSASLDGQAEKRADEIATQLIKRF